MRGPPSGIRGRGTRGLDRFGYDVLGLLRASEPPGVPHELYWASVLAVLGWAVSLGLQATVLSMIVFGPRAPAVAPELLTAMGRANVRPEWELPVFAVGCLVIMAACFLAVRVWSALLAEHPSAAREAVRGAALHAGLAVASGFAFVVLSAAVRFDFGSDGRLPGAAVGRLAAPGLAALLAWGGYHVLARRRSRRRP